MSLSGKEQIIKENLELKRYNNILCNRYEETIKLQYGCVFTIPGPEFAAIMSHTAAYRSILKHTETCCILKQ